MINYVFSGFVSNLLSHTKVLLPKTLFNQITYKLFIIANDKDPFSKCFSPRQDRASFERTVCVLKVVMSSTAASKIKVAVNKSTIQVVRSICHEMKTAAKQVIIAYNLVRSLVRLQAFSRSSVLNRNRSLLRSGNL